MDRHFNIAGPNLPGLHYMLPSLRRLPQAPELVERECYFVVHAPRQSGKTTVIRALAEQLTASGQYAALNFSARAASGAGDDYPAAQHALLNEIRREASLTLGNELQPPKWPDASQGTILLNGLTAWALSCPRPVVLLIDDISTLSGRSAVSVLSQMRAGFTDRQTHFPASMIFCGLHDIRAGLPPCDDPIFLDYPFNIKEEVIRLSEFTVEEIAELYEQHTSDTGQQFTAESVERVFELTQGQPWLVNALAKHVVEELAPQGEAVTVDHIDQAKDLLIHGKSTHMDELLTEIRKPGVRELLEPRLTGKIARIDMNVVDCVRDLGIIKLTSPVEIANPIYHEFITRTYAPNPAWNMPDPDDPQPVEQENSLTS